MEFKKHYHGQHSGKTSNIVSLGAGHLYRSHYILMYNLKRTSTHITNFCLGTVLSTQVASSFCFPQNWLKLFQPNLPNRIDKSIGQYWTTACFHNLTSVKLENIHSCQGGSSNGLPGNHNHTWLDSVTYCL